MASVTLFHEGLRGPKLPDVCATCGAPAGASLRRDFFAQWNRPGLGETVDLVRPGGTRSLGLSQYSITLPFCEKHARPRERSGLNERWSYLIPIPFFVGLFAAIASRDPRWGVLSLAGLVGWAAIVSFVDAAAPIGILPVDWSKPRRLTLIRVSRKFRRACLESDRRLMEVNWPESAYLKSSGDGISPLVRWGTRLNVHRTSLFLATACGLTAISETCEWLIGRETLGMEFGTIAAIRSLAFGLFCLCLWSVGMRREPRPIDRTSRGIRIRAEEESLLFFVFWGGVLFLLIGLVGLLRQVLGWAW